MASFIIPSQMTNIMQGTIQLENTQPASVNCLGQVRERVGAAKTIQWYANTILHPQTTPRTYFSIILYSSHSQNLYSPHNT